MIYSSAFGRVNLGELEPTFSQSVISMAHEKYSKLSDFYKKAGLSKQVASKMSNEENYLPTKKNAFACVVALELNPDAAETLLRKGSYTFSDSNLMDVIVKFFLLNGQFDIDSINEVLSEYEQPLLGSA